MSHIVLTPEQMQIVEQSTGLIEVRDPDGKVLSRILSRAEEDLVARILARRGQDRTTYPAAVVRARLQRLEEIRASKGMDREKMRDLLRRMRVGEQV